MGSFGSRPERCRGAQDKGLKPSGGSPERSSNRGEPGSAQCLRTICSSCVEQRPGETRGRAESGTRTDIQVRDASVGATAKEHEEQDRR